MQDDDHGGRREEVKEETAEWGRHYEGMTRQKVVHRILLRLPAKSLLRFRCVSRRWNGIISSNSFVHAHAAAPRLVSGLLYQSSQGTLVYSQFCYATASLPDPSLSFLPEPVVVKASARGLLCCRGRFSMMYYVCNPSTAVWVSLPQPGNLHNYRTEVVLMIDDLPRSNRFTEFRVVCAFPEVGIPHHVYGLETFSTDEWRWATSKWSPRLGGLLPGSGVVVGGRACWRTTMDTVFMYDPRDEERLGFERPKRDLDGVTWWEIGVIDGQLSVAYAKVAWTPDSSTMVEVMVADSDSWSLWGTFGFGPGSRENNLKPLRMEGDEELLLWDGQGHILGRDMVGRATRLLVVDAPSTFNVEFVPYTATLLHVKR
ncbi:hypothetical protein BHE74_00038314 [Ensete ventricosum]|nr:hypothetical protein BHE74_00038314 [Ensete ventricosum]